MSEPLELPFGTTGSSLARLRSVYAAAALAVIHAVRVASLVVVAVDVAAVDVVAVDVDAAQYVVFVERSSRLKVPASS